MARSLTTGLQSHIAAAQLAPVMFVELSFSSGYVRAWNGYGVIEWDGKSWTGGGELMSVGAIEEVSTVEAVSLSLSLSSVPSALVATAYGDFSQGRQASVWIGAMDVNAGTIVSDPQLMARGRMDTIADDDDGTTAVITVSVESHLADLERVRARYLTDQDQQRIFPGDRSLRFVPSLQDKPVYWGVVEVG